MKRNILWIVMVGMGVVIAAILIYLWTTSAGETTLPLPPGVASPTASPETIFSRTATRTTEPTMTASPTATASASATVTLATRIEAISVVMPDVTLPASATPLPENVRILAEAPAPVEPLLDATLLPFPYMAFSEWVSFESDHPAVQYPAGQWTPLPSQHASQGQYHYTEDTAAVVRFSFVGAAVRVRYVGFINGGLWELMVDGVVLARIDSYAPIGMFTGTQVYTLAPGEHRLELRNTEEANPASTGHLLALDAIQVYQPDALTWLVPGGVLPTATATPTLIPVKKIALVQAPPSPPPTATDVPLQAVSAAIVIGYDENANGTLDVSEGVRGISVRLVEVGTNNVLAHAFTDAQGFAELHAAAKTSVLLVVPYFSEVWTVQRQREGRSPTFTLLLSPGNQPGLIP